MVASAGYLAGSCRCAEQPVLRASDRPSEDIASVQNGGSLRGRAKTQVALRDRLPVGLRPRLAELTAAD